MNTGLVRKIQIHVSFGGQTVSYRKRRFVVIRIEGKLYCWDMWSKVKTKIILIYLQFQIFLKFFFKNL